MGNTIEVLLRFDEDEYDIVRIFKNPKCCIKGCDDYGTKGMCTLRMCDKHFNQARD